jgi:hypothetical protein
MVMKVIQREVDAAKSSCDMIREQVVELLDEARGLLTGDIKVPDDTPLANVANTAAHKLLNGLSGVAALCATLRWHDSLINTMKASEPMESVAAALKDFAFMDACRLCESESPLHNAFDQAILEYAVDAAKFVGRTLAAFDKANEVCEKYGIDINKIQAGDKETLKTYVDAVAHMTASPLMRRFWRCLALVRRRLKGSPTSRSPLALIRRRSLKFRRACTVRTSAPRPRKRTKTRSAPNGAVGLPP